MRFYTKSVKSVAQIESVAQIDIQKFGNIIRSGVGYRMKSRISKSSVAEAVSVVVWNHTAFNEFHNVLI